MGAIDDAQAALQRGDWRDALARFDALSAEEQSTLEARYGKATAQMELGFVAVAEAEFAKLYQEHPNNTSILFMRGKTKIIGGQVDAGLQDIESVWQSKPSVLALRLLAGTAWMQGDMNKFNAHLQAGAAIADFIPTVADILREAGFPEVALRSIGSAEPSIEKDTYEAHIHIALGDAVSAEAAAVRALKQKPGYQPALSHYVVALLMNGKASTALEALSYARKADPQGQRWIADEIVARNLVRDFSFAPLAKLDQHVRSYELPVPPGFGTIEDFNAALVSTVEKYQQYDMHPIGQSLRGGSQTRIELSELDDPVIQAYFLALDGPIRQYMRTIGADPDDLFASRNSGEYRVSGSWSVTLRGGGNHVNHFHPEGWISSSYYVSVPPETTDETRRAGWIKFGEPPYQTNPPSPALKWIQPKAGMLVLFPSYLWHGTEPIDEGSTRITAPFDIVPA